MATFQWVFEKDDNCRNMVNHQEIKNKLQMIAQKNVESIARLKDASGFIDNEIIRKFLIKYANQKQRYNLKLDEGSLSGNTNQPVQGALDNLRIQETQNNCMKTKKILEFCRKNEQELIFLYETIIENEVLPAPLKDSLSSQLDHIVSGVEKMELMEKNLVQSELE